MSLIYDLEKIKILCPICEFFFVVENTEYLTHTHGENGESLKEIDNSVYSKYW